MSIVLNPTIKLNVVYELYEDDDQISHRIARTKEELIGLVSGTRRGPIIE